MGLCIVFFHRADVIFKINYIYIFLNFLIFYLIFNCDPVGPHYPTLLH